MFLQSQHIGLQKNSNLTRSDGFRKVSDNALHHQLIVF